MTKWWSLGLAAVLLAPLSAQSPPEVEEPEAPEALFEEKIGDVGVVLEAEGTWTTRLAGGWGLGWTPEGALPGLGYPGLTRGGVFAQEPDFSLTLRLLERYYLSVVYSGSLEERSFLVGYEGAEGEALRWIKVGNAAFSVPTRANQPVADGRRGAPALGAALVLGTVSLEGVARYEDGARETRTYRGYHEATSLQVGLDQWIRGRFFLLPASAPLTGIRVAVLDKGRFREATASEVNITGSGEVQLAVPATRLFAVTWDGAGSWSPPLTGTPLLKLVAQTVTGPGLESGTWYELAGPGRDSPFEARNRYPVPVGTQGVVRLVDRDTGRPVEGYRVGQIPTRDWFEVSGDVEAPFYGAYPGIYPTQDAAPPHDPTVSWVFELPPSGGQKSFSLGNDVLGSSVVVVRNSLPAAFGFDEATGQLDLESPVYDTDAIEVSFQRRVSGRKASDLFLWQGGQWNLGADHALEWALQGRWNMDRASHTTADLQSPGRAALSLAYEGKAGEWSWRAEGTAGAVLADSTGRRRLYEFGGEGTIVAWNGDSLRPSAAPGSVDSFNLTNSNRATLAFRDYWTNDALTGEPQVSAWGKPGIERQPSGPEGWVGPYLVRGDGTRSDRLAVLEGDPGNGEWMALQAAFDQGRPRDLGSTSAISVTVRVPGGTSGRIFLQAGALSDDWDGTGAARSLEYRQWPALAFFPAAVRQNFPVPEGSSWGNDADGDGTPSPGGPLVTREITGAGDSWTTVRLHLTDAERQILRQATGWRLIYVETTGGVPRTVLVGPVAFEGAAWTVRPAATPVPSSTVSPVETTDPSDATRRQLQVNWSNRSNWTIEGRHSPVRPASYRRVSFLYRVSTATTLSLALADGQGRGVTATWVVAATGGWTRAIVHLNDLTMTVDGQPTGNVALKPGAASWDRLVLASDGSTTGELALAEVEAIDPVWEPVGSSLVKATWKQTTAWPDPTFALLSGSTLTLTSSQSGLTATDGVWRGETTWSGTLGPLRGSAEARFLQASQERSARGAYEATLPLGAAGLGLEWTDRFSDEGLRAERLVLRLPWLGTWDALASAQGPPRSLDQTYSLGWSADTGGFAGWGLQATSRWFQSRPQTTTLEGFGPVWVESWRWLQPGSSLAPYHVVSLDAKLKGESGPWSWELADANHASQSQGNETTWSTWGDWTTKGTFRSGQDEWSFTPSLSRSAEQAYAGESLRHPGESALQGWRRLWSADGLASPPFSELAPGAWGPQSDAFRAGKTATSAAVDWERAPTSDVTDLWVPGSASLGGRVARAREGSSAYSTQTLTGRWQAKALNLFGQLGSSPTFDWYRTEVLSWSAAAQWTTGSRDADRLVEGSFTTLAEWILTPDESLRLPTAYQGRSSTTATHSLRVSPSWSLRGPADLPFELPRWLSPSAFRRQWVQDLSLALDLGWQPDPAPLVRDLQVTWKGRLLLSDKSELSLTTKWGQQWKPSLTVVGMEASLALILDF